MWVTKTVVIYCSLCSASYIPDVSHDPSQISLKPYRVSDSRELRFIEVLGL